MPYSNVPEHLTGKMDSCVKSVMKENPDYSKEKAISICHSQIVKQAYVQDPKRQFYLLKEKDQYRWIGVYSNNFIDRDRPPDIISRDSHKRFVEMVDKGLYEPPELWLFHAKNLRFGQADWVAYDEQGFAVAGGTIDDNEWARAVALKMADVDNAAMSHSMPVYSIKRDPADPRVIVEHKTIEVSVLPDWAAASQLTDFVIVKGVAEMKLDEKKRKALVEDWGLDEDVLEGLGAANSNRKNAAEVMGLESKEVTEEKETDEPVEKKAGKKDDGDKEGPIEEAIEDEVEEEEMEEEKAISDPVEKKLDDFSVSIRKEVADALVEFVEPVYERLDNLTALNEKMVERIQELEGQVELEEKEIEEDTPTSSIVDWMHKKSVIGKGDTKVDGRTSLAKDGPKETPVVAGEGPTGIQFLDGMLTGKNGNAE